MLGAVPCGLASGAFGPGAVGPGVVRRRLQVALKDDAAFAEGEGAEDAVAKLPDVARPVVVHELAQGPPGDVGQGAREAGAGHAFLHEGRDHQRDVGLVLAQGRGADGDDRQAEEEVLAEVAKVHLLAQVGVGGCHDAGVELDELVAAKGRNGAVGEGAEQGLLDAQGGCAYLVEHEGAAFGCQKGPLAGLLGLGEGPLDVAEERVHEQAFVQGAAVDGDEGAVLEPRLLVDGPAHQLLAGAGLAHDEHVLGDLGGLGDVALEFGDFEARADDAVGRQDHVAREVLDRLQLEPGVGQRVCHVAVLLQEVEPVEQNVDRAAQRGHFPRLVGLGKLIDDALARLLPQLALKPLQGLGNAPGHGPEQGRHGKDGRREGACIDEGEDGSRPRGREGRVQDGNAADHVDGAAGVGLVGDGRIAHRLHGQGSVPPAAPEPARELAILAVLDVVHHAPVAVVVGAGAEGAGKAGPAEVAVEAHAHGVEPEGLAGIGLAFVLEDHPAFGVDVDGAQLLRARQELGVVPRGEEARESAAQGLEVDGKGKDAGKGAVGAEDLGGEADDVQGQLALHAGGRAHHGVDHFGGRGDEHLVGALHVAGRPEGRARDVLDLLGVEGDDLAVVAEQEIGVFARCVHEGQFAVAVVAHLGTELHALRHVLLFHGSGSQHQQLVARFGKHLAQGIAEGMGLDARIARSGVVDDGVHGLARTQEDCQQHGCHDGHGKKNSAGHKPAAGEVAGGGQTVNAHRLCALRHGANLARWHFCVQTSLGKNCASGKCFGKTRAWKRAALRDHGLACSLLKELQFANKQRKRFHNPLIVRIRRVL